jgi:hypothetical protein
VTRIAFVYVDTSQCYVVWVESEALITYTRGLYAIHLTIGVFSTIDSITWGFTTSGGVSNEPVLTDTFIATFSVNAFGIWSARQTTEKTLICVPTPTFCSQFNLFITGSALTLIASVRVNTFGINSTDISVFAFIHIYAFNATDLISRSATTGAVDTPGVLCAVKIKFTGDVHRCSITAQLRCSARHIFIRTDTLI